MVLPYLAAAASSTDFAAGQISTPVPSPSMKGMMGLSGTASVPSDCIEILSAMALTVSATPQVPAILSGARGR